MPIHAATPMATSLVGKAYDNLKGKLDNTRVESIAYGDRHRKIDDGKVAELMENLKLVGLLQPIGVRYMSTAEMERYSDGHRIALVYGAHRLEAHKRLFRAATTEEEKGRWEFIPCIIYPTDMAESWAELAEITENLKRHDLSSDERNECTARLTVLYKETGLVVDANTSRSQRQKGRPKKRPQVPDLLEREGSHFTHVPTATAKLASDLGKSERAVKSDFAALSRRSGVKVTAESTPEDLRKAIDGSVKARKQKPSTKMNRARKAPEKSEEEKDYAAVPIKLSDIRQMVALLKKAKDVWEKYDLSQREEFVSLYGDAWCNIVSVDQLRQK